MGPYLGYLSVLPVTWEGDAGDVRCRIQYTPVQKKEEPLGSSFLLSLVEAEIT